MNTSPYPFLAVEYLTEKGYRWYYYKWVYDRYVDRFIYRHVTRNGHVRRNRTLTYNWLTPATVNTQNTRYEETQPAPFDYRKLPFVPCWSNGEMDTMPK